MPRGSARYTGDGTGQIIPDFSEAVRHELRALLVGFVKSTPEEIETGRIFARGHDADWRRAHPVNEIVGEMLARAYPLKVQIADYKLRALKKCDLVAEYQSLLETLSVTEQGLRSMSAELDVLLGVDADPLGTADSIQLLLTKVKSAQTRVKDSADRPRDRQFKAAVARDLIQEIAEICTRHGLPTKGRDSPLVKIVTAIGDEMALSLDERTWRNRASAALPKKTSSR